LLSGNSGVGKSTLVNAIEPSALAKTGEISEAHLQGKHTTTFSHVYPLSFGGRIIDTPGIRGFGLIDIKPEELYHYFPELMLHSKGCKFYNCTHTHEPHCAVVEAVTQGLISMSRYESYLKILDDDGKYR
ncbi:MAG: ribosome small subunit-dependent GTPase A, partial [Tidjanibacter sp.]|nr:ribosome small subunit-dependent GTPase A [Tidjanibacter sp.]